MDKSAAFEEGKRAAWLSIWTVVSIGVVEILLSITTGSLTLLADGIDSMSDALISFIVWFGISMLQKPRSKLFHFGYGKVESLAAFVAAVIVVILGISIIYGAYERLANPVEITNPEIVMMALLASGSISLHRALRVRSVARKYNLVSLQLEAKNSIKDSSSSFVGFASVLAAYFGIPHMDSIGSIMIAGYIFFIAYTALKESTLVLVDAAANPSLREEIARYIQSEFQIKVEDVLIRPLGHTFHAQIHIELARDMTLDQLHNVKMKLENALAEEFKIEAIVIPKPV